MKIIALKTYMQRVDVRPRLLVKVETDEGISGWGEAYNHGPDHALIPVLEYMFRQIEGVDPRRVEYVVRRLLQEARFPPGAIGMAAISAIDQALWDISGKAAGLPVYMLLGGNVRDRVPVYCGVYTAPDPPACLDLTQEMNERYGFTAFKLSPYRRDLYAGRWGNVCKEAADYFAEIRSISPPEWQFAFEAHARIFEPRQAIQLGNALAPYDPLWFEEPIRPEYIPAWGHLRSQLNVPLATGESLFMPQEYLALLTAGGADIVQPDVCVVGGLAQMRRIAAIAETHYVSVAPHNPMGPLATAVNVHFAAAHHGLKLLEYKPSETTWCPDQYLPVDGHLELRPERPGWGVEIDESALGGDDYVHWERVLPIRSDGSTGYV
ncbi:mandelate racemase/muconate lactonizing enzyme family protein [Nonomuraea insulae]|uniref:Mandelate racemase/muconate lactonizing enzyme family protein n=1 Tax=Nonomuraea insulae TaxID=1616787 RepID=A0ABW1D462_9ACTN